MGTEYLPDLLLSVVFQRGEVTEMHSSQLRGCLLRDRSAANTPPHLMPHLASPCSLRSAQQNHPLLWGASPHRQPVLLLGINGINHGGN